MYTKVMNIGGLLDRFISNNEPLFGYYADMLNVVSEEGTDIYRTTATGDTVLEIEMAGIRKEDISIELERGELAITGKSIEAAEEGREYRCRGRRSREIERRYKVPSGIDESGVRADYVDGVLRVTLKKSEPAKVEGRKIAIG